MLAIWEEFSHKKWEQKPATWRLLSNGGGGGGTVITGANGEVITPTARRVINATTTEDWVKLFVCLSGVVDLNYKSKTLRDLLKDTKRILCFSGTSDKMKEI